MAGLHKIVHNSNHSIIDIMVIVIVIVVILIGIVIVIVIITIMRPCWKATFP